MIVIKTGRREKPPDLFAFQGPLWIFSFYGDETFTDPYDGSIWYWVGTDNTLQEILSITENGESLFPVNSIEDAETLESAFFWDDSTGKLYVHWKNAFGDWSVSRETGNYTKIIPGYASGFDAISKNIFDGVFYNPIVSQIGALTKSVDPLKFGLLSFSNSSFSLTDKTGVFENLPAEYATGLPVRVYNVPSGATTLTREMLIFTGSLYGYRHNRQDITFDIIESRLYENKPACQSVITLTDWPFAGGQEGAFVPHAWGTIRRGILVCVNEDALDTDSSGTAIFLAGDKNYGALRAVTAIYDEKGNSRTIVLVTLAECEIRVTKPAGISPSDLKAWTWEGEGYNIPNFNNGPAIMKDAFRKIAGVPYIESTFDTLQWERETVKNSAPIGLSIQTDRGLTEALIEPITVSLQCIVDTLGDGRLTIFSRDTTADIVYSIPKTLQLDLPDIQIDPKEVVSEFVVEYAPNFANSEALQILVDAEKENTIYKYGINRRDPISPVKTVLATKADAGNLGLAILETSKEPPRKISTEITGLPCPCLFSIVKIDTGQFWEERNEYIEILSVQQNSIEQKTGITGRVIPGYRERTTEQGTLFGDIFNSHILGGTRNV